MEERARRALEAALPAYEVGDELGRGAFGVVYAARHVQLGRDVAIKVLPQVFATDETVRGRFVSEAQMVASLDHPHIVPVYDYVENEHACMLIMERCAASVGDRFKADGIATDEACSAVLSCLAALDLAHERGVLHRDVKPENLMLDTKGVVKLADFGIARALDSEVRHTKTGMVIGTPAYMSPEQVRGEELTPASDVYSVAMMAFELLTGTLPFPGTPSVVGLLAHHLTTEPLPLLSAQAKLPGSIGVVIDRALSKSLEDRHETAEEFASDLSRACVRSFGSGWLRRRGFTLHWPDMVAENERSSSGQAAGTTDTIMIQATTAPHEVIGPEEAFAAWNDTLLGRSALTSDEPHTTPAPPAAPPQPQPQPQPQPPAPPATSTGTIAAGGGSGGGSGSGSDGSRNTLVWVLGGVAALLVVAIAAFVLFSPEGDDADETASTDSVAGSTAPAGVDGDSAADSPTTVDEAAQPSASGVPETTLPVVEPVEDPAQFSNRPDGYVATDASTPLQPTPCPEGQPQVACIHSSVEVGENGAVTLGFFTEGFVPALESGGERVHFYFDTTVDGDETAAGAGSSVPEFRPWGQPFDIAEMQGDNGGVMFTVDEARAADARYLCIIVADANQVAVPGTGNCAPFLQTWDQATLGQQAARLPGEFIGRCAIGVTAVVPDGWRSADLVAESPAGAAERLFPTDGNADATFQRIVDEGGVLYADGLVSDGTQADLIFSIVPGAFRIGSNPQQVEEQLGILGVDVGTTTEQIVGGQPVLTSTTTDDTGDLTTKRYFVTDFGYLIELTVVVESNAGTGFVDTIADTVLGC